MKYKIGDTVRIKDDFERLRYSDDPSIDPKMHKYAGLITTITRIASSTHTPWYKLENNVFVWDERWLDIVENDIEMTENDIMEMFKKN